MGGGYFIQNVKCVVSSGGAQHEVVVPYSFAAERNNGFHSNNIL